MSELVFLEPNKIDAVPFTTSEAIAEFSGVGRKKIKMAIKKHQADLEAFGKVVPYETTFESGQTVVGYRLTEEQATFLITLLKNTPVVVAFKKELVRQFYAMRTELLRRQSIRAELKPIRRELTDVIKETGDGPWSYKKYTDLAYKSTLGKNAAQLRKERSAPKKARAIDYMSSAEIAAVAKRQSQIAVLLEMGWGYESIKALLLHQALPALAGGGSSA